MARHGTSVEMVICDFLLTFSFITLVDFTTSILLPNYRMGGNYMKQRSKNYYAMTFAQFIKENILLEIYLKELIENERYS